MKNVSLKINSINYDDYYKLSKSMSDELLQSIKVYGVIDPIFVFPENSMFRILSGHNRYLAASALQLKDIPVKIIENDILENLYNTAILKKYNKQLGFISKIKFVMIFNKDKEINNLDYSALMAIPEEAYSDSDTVEAIMTLPETMKTYLNDRDVSYKTIKKLIHIDNEIVQLLSAFLTGTDFRVNYLRNIVDMMFDMQKISLQSNIIDVLKQLLTCEDSEKKDQVLYENMFKCRYPEYSQLKIESEKVAAKYKKYGIAVKYPDYFEGGEVHLEMSISKKDKGSSFIKTIDKLDELDVNELLSFL